MSISFLRHETSVVATCARIFCSSSSFLACFPRIKTTVHEVTKTKTPLKIRPFFIFNGGFAEGDARRTPSPVGIAVGNDSVALERYSLNMKITVNKFPLYKELSGWYFAILAQEQPT